MLIGVLSVKAADVECGEGGGVGGIAPLAGNISWIEKG
jgi:hypothetical protein